MQCSSCEFDNAPQAKFCEACGAQLTRACAGCGHPVSPGARFCSQCGTAVAGDQPPAQQSRVHATPPQAIAGERRQLTVLFCDLVGSTELAARLDPEDWRDVAAQYQRSAAEAVTRVGGHVAKYLGDGLLVYFGWPHAYGNDAERAVRAGLAILEAVRALNNRVGAQFIAPADAGGDAGARKQDAPGAMNRAPTGGGTTAPVTLSVRVGIHSGPVVVAQEAGREADAFGETPNVAARVQAVAAPDTVVLTAATLGLVAGRFDVEELGAERLKGISEPVRLYRALRPTGVRDRIHAAAARGLTPFVGREHERQLLLDRWERVREGEGQVVLLVGEAGIGKSRLVRQFRESLGNTPHLWTEYGGSPFFQQTPLYVVAELLQKFFTWRDDEPPAARYRAIERALAAAQIDTPDAPRLVASLLGVAPPDDAQRAGGSAEQQRRVLLATLVTWTLRAAQAQPMVIVTEDLHWVDPSTLELHGLLVQQGATVPLMLVYTTRPEFEVPWPQRPHHTHLSLNRLGRREVQDMVEGVAGRMVLAPEILRTVVTRTDGVPLFVEELTKAVVEAGGVAVQEIPATLQESLLARLDRLGGAKDVAQVAAVLGREFSYSVLLEVSPFRDAELQESLQRLTDADLVYARGLPPQASYQFKHALVQETAYSSLLKSRRRELHRRTAEVLVERFPDVAAAQPEVLAHHLTEAGALAQAIGYWQRAGRRAFDRSAHQESIGHLTRGLELVEQLPDTAERIQQELGLLLTLGATWMAAGGYAAPQVERAYSRAHELCQRLGASPQLVPALLGLWGFHFVRANHRTARQLAEQILELVQRQPDLRSQAAAHQRVGISASYQGEPLEARRHFERTIELERGEDGGPLIIGGARSGTRAHFALALWMLGYADQAFREVMEAWAIARTLSHPLEIAQALGVGIHCLVYRQDWELVDERTPELITLSAEQGLPLWWACGLMLQTGAMIERGRAGEAITQIREGLAEWEKTGARLGMGVYMCLLARACARTERIDEGLQAVADARALSAETGEYADEAELCRLQGVLTLQRAAAHGDAALEREAEACFLSAVDLARRQNAKAWELRASTDLARLWRRQGKRDARRMLAEVYGWFTEGFDTRDLRAARALLDEPG
jgi:class 3 adenylate cyclase/predicted ATPase